MLTEVFYWTLNMSIAAGLMGAIVLAVRRIKAVPRFLVYCLWAIPLVRFWIPFGVTGEFGLIPLISRFTTRSVPAFEGPQLAYTNFVMAADDYFPLSFKSEGVESAFHIAGIIWAIVFCALIITAALLYYFTKTEVRGAKHTGGNVYVMKNISSPAVYGIIKPKIIIPEDLPDGTIKYALMHERVHLRRGDNLLRCIAVVTACLHWFNPLAWVFLKYFFEDMELSCDAKILKTLDKSEHKGYALALLGCASKKSLAVSAFGAPRIRVRIENILSYKKLSLVSGACFLALALAITAALLTNAPG